MEAVDLVNAALRENGSRAISAISDTTPAGAIAGDVYTYKRDALLRAHTWNFASTRTPLSRLAIAPGFEFSYAYRLPSDWLRTVSVHDNDAGEGQAVYKLESVFTPELATNGAFDTDTGWTKGTGWTISGGKASHAAGSQSNLTQSISFTTSGVYRVTVTVSGLSAGGVTTRLSGGTNVDGVSRTYNGTFSDDLTAVSGNNTLAFVGETSFDGSIDNVSVVRIDGDDAAVKALLSDAESVWLRYIRQVTDVNLMTPGFQQALIFLLAKTFATGHASSNTLREISKEDLRDALRIARSTDAIEDYPERRPEGSWAMSRRGRWG